MYRLDAAPAPAVAAVAAVGQRRAVRSEARARGDVLGVDGADELVGGGVGRPDLRVGVARRLARRGDEGGEAGDVEGGDVLREPAEAPLGRERRELEPDAGEQVRRAADRREPLRPEVAQRLEARAERRSRKTDRVFGRSSGTRDV